MVIGILSDTHGRVEPAARAVQLLLDNRAEMLVHCGDVGSETVLDQLAGHPAAFVFGNNDWDRTGLARYAEQLQIQCLHDFGTLELGHRKLAIAHGDDDRILRKVLDGQQHDYLLLGHTHHSSDRRVGRTRVINPGALHRAAVWSVALLDLSSDRLQFLRLER